MSEEQSVFNAITQKNLFEIKQVFSWGTCRDNVHSSGGIGYRHNVHFSDI